MITGFGLVGELNHLIYNIDAVLPDNIYWDYKLKRYRHKGGVDGAPIRGSFVSRNDVIRLQKTRLNQLMDKLPSYAERVYKQEIGVQRELADVIKQIHILEVVIYKNGFDKVTPSELGIIGAELKKQYYSGISELDGQPYGLKNLIETAKQNSIPQIQNRLRMFGQSGGISKNKVEIADKKAQGYTEKYRLLHPGENCPECLYYASLGRVPIDDDVVPLPKQRCSCRTNCRCDIIYV